MKDVPLAQLCSKDYIRTVGRVWERFVTDRPVDDDGVRDVVIESWRRCRQNGVDPATKSAPLRVDGPEVDRFKLRNAPFYDAVRACVPPIVPHLADSRIILITSDPDGTLLSVDGDPHFTDRLAADHIVPGAAWHECSSGTNAVGTALALGRSLHIHAEEHFCEVAKPWSCTAAVIRDPVDRRIVGVVDITGPPETVNAQTWPFVMSLVGQLQGHLQKQALARRARLIELFEAAIGGRETAAVLLDTEGRMIARTSQASEVLRKHGLDRTRTMGELVATPRGEVAPKRLASLAPGIRREWLSPLEEGGQCVGAILHLPTAAREQRARSQSTATPQPPLAPALHHLLQTSPSLESVLHQAQRFAAGRTPLLLEGETGTGKELVARMLHRSGRRRSKPFIAVNCAALPEGLAEIELFGHAADSVPHTRLSRTGRIASSSGGTLLLDEIDSMPLTMQARLLRVLEEREVQPIGAERPEAVDLRVIATAKQDIARAVAEGRFRADLYYRLATMRLRVPALRECTGDVFLLFAAFVEEAKQQLGTSDVALGPAVHAHLAGHHWPGNVRELKNFALEVASGRSLAGAADADVRTDLPTRLAKFEENLIRDALLRHGGRVSRALEELGVPRKTLYDKITRLGIDLAELRRSPNPPPSSRP